MIRVGVTTMKIWKGTVFLNPQIKSAYSGYRDQAIRILSIQHEIFQLRIGLTNIKGRQGKYQNINIWIWKKIKFYFCNPHLFTGAAVIGGTAFNPRQIFLFLMGLFTPFIRKNGYAILGIKKKIKPVFRLKGHIW